MSTTTQVVLEPASLEFADGTASRLIRSTSGPPSR